MRTPRPIAVLGLLLVLAAAAYWPVLQCGFVWDDDDYVTQNPVLRTQGGLWTLWTEPRSLPQYYPLVHTTFWLEYRLWGLDPTGYHVVNVLLHTLAAWRLWHLARALALPGALFAAAWFLVHPVHVESVAWVTERKNVLSLLCALLAAERWLAWHDGGRPRAYAAGTAWFVAALLSKTVVATVPAALLVVVWWRDGRAGARAWRGALPWLVLGAALGGITAWLEATHVGAAATPWQLEGAERVLVAGRAVWFYLGSLLWPVGTCFNYPRWQLDTGSLAQWAWPAAALAALAAAFALRRHVGRGPLAVLLLFGGMLVPALGFFDVYPFRYSFVADHFQYHASTAVLAGVAAAVAARAAARVPPAALRALAAAVVAACAVLTLLGIPRFRDFDELWRVTLAQNPASAIALTNLGAKANLRGDRAEAKALLERALAIDATNHDAMVNLGAIAHRQGDRTAARQWYERALATKAGDAGGSHNLAVLLLEDGRAADALPHAETAAAASPDDVNVRATLAWALHDLRRWEGALEHCDYVLQRVPGELDTRRRAATCLWHLRRLPQAAGNAMALLKAQPADPEAGRVYAEAAVQLLAKQAPAQARATVVADCNKHGVDPAPVLARIAALLRARGDPDRAVVFEAR
jgi:tetratricopeptide (TPR) repeat protein